MYLRPPRPTRTDTLFPSTTLCRSTVRGFGGDFNETLYDGRRISTATGGRSVDFSTVGADFVGTLSVLKTPDVSLSASSIGATVNVEFPKPFDHPGMRIAVTGSGSLQEDRKRPRLNSSH